MGSIKILHLTSSLQEDGPGNRLLALFKNAAREKYRLFLCSLSQPDPQIVRKFSAIGVEVNCLQMRHFFDFRVMPRLMRILLAQQIDVLHCHNLRADYYGRIAGKAVRLKLILSTIGGEYTSYNRINYGYLTYWVIKQIDRLIMARLCDHFIAVSDGVKMMVQKEWKVPIHKVITIYNGIDLDDFDERFCKNNNAEHWNRGERPVLGTVMAFKKSKGYEFLIEAVNCLVSQFPSLLVLCVGGGNRKDVEEHVWKKGLKDNFVFLGHCSDVEQFYNELDIFVFPSYSEGCPRSVLEAMAASRPVVAANVGGNNELVKDGFNGLLVPPKDPESLAFAISRLLKDHDLRQKMGEKGRLLVKSRFTARYNAVSIQDLIERLLEDGFRRGVIYRMNGSAKG